MIPYENRMSTVPVPGLYLIPDNIIHNKFTDNEAGPIARSDPSGGQKAQTWELIWEPGTGDFILTPQTIGDPVVVLNAVNVQQIGLAFDQNGQEAICYNTFTNGYLYWWDSSVPGFVTTDFGTEFLSLALTLDDKRSRQTQVNDVILWYIKLIGNQYNLYNRIQRQRYTEETLMSENVDKYITQVGMHDGTRVQVTTRAILYQ
jgi:hypothetical protein